MYTAKYNSTGLQVHESPTFATVADAWHYIIHVRLGLGGMYV